MRKKYILVFGTLISLLAFLQVARAQCTVSISTISPVLCATAENTTLNAVVSNGTPPYTYLWNTAETTQSILGVNGGYTVTVPGCGSATIEITNDPPINIIATHNNVTCDLMCNGSASVSVNGGTSGYSYNWSPAGGNTTTATGLCADTYTLLVTDAAGCTQTNTVDVTSPSPLSVSSSHIDPLCYGGNDGSSSVSVSGGTSPYTYNWNNGQIAQLATGLSAGNYSVTVTDHNGCVSSLIIAISQPPLLASTNSQVNVKCFGGNNGEASAVANGGTAPYTYAWSNGGTTSQITNLTSQNYSVTITDADGCKISPVFLIAEPPLLTSSITIANVTCNAGNDGNATANPSGGVLPYTYSWSNGGTTSQISNLSSQTYSVDISDGNGCVNSQTFAVTEPPPITYSAAVTNVLCNGGNNGSLEVHPSGGISPYTYLWSNGGTTSQISNLTSQIYSFTITDANGCAATYTLSVTQPSAITSNIIQNDVSCSGGSNGTASVVVNGGSPPFSYLWTNGQTVQTAIGLIAENYSVTITDANGCIHSNSVTITEPLAISETVAVTPEYCNQGNGNASANVSGGMGNYTYNWNTVPVQTTQTAAGLSAGNYSVSITDANGCVKTASATITNVNGGAAFIFSHTDVSCNGEANGTATALESSGYPPYTFLWSSGGQTAQTVTGLSSGNYSVTITDVNGCQSSTSVTITQPAALSVTTSVTPENCNHGNGSAIVNPGGGVGNYSYDWNTAPAQSTQTATGLSAGNYSVTVSDANGCTATTSVSVSNINGTASISSSTNVLCHGGANGSAVAVSSGSAPFTYSWSNGNNTQSVTGLAAGTYSVAITDVNGCVGTASVLITQPAALSFTISSTANTKCNFPNGTVTMNIAGGSNPFTYHWSTIPVQTTATAAALTAGTYSVVVTDKNGCTVTSSVTVAAPSLPVINIMGNTTICQGSSTMLIASGGAIYWNPGHQDADTIVSPSVTTNYSVVAVGANGCTNTSSVTVTVIPRPVAGINGNTNICIGETATLTAFGGGSYLWSPGGQTSSAISTSTGGMYSVIVTAGSCSATATHPVIVHPPPTANAGANATVNYGSSTQLSASGGSSYNWEPSAGLSCTNCANPICAPAAATTYTVIATDANGCTASAMVTVYVNEECGELYLPNAFSPNGDGENDYLHIDIMNPVCISEFKISIWDRWGNKVFESTDKNFKWNGDDAYGLFPGSERTAVFVYRMTAVLMERKVIERKGNISLIR